MSLNTHIPYGYASKVISFYDIPNIYTFSKPGSSLRIDIAEYTHATERLFPV